ncbi:type I restriction enzyme, S subunit [Marinobacter sp. es.048]|uniref:restriction endonuclease subunit S n=1 Tax=Marinobacter sp. es.048 TaxID=1761795 RepID=UPI000B6FA45B|nr:restriction endonuclease subunit S [Marinobacter sp. es.048]SNC74481.1 type I restriction enzyme, S subunit [Marinobacter sp. es.048]
MIQTWPSFRLKEICDISSSRRIRAHEYTKSGVPFYRGKEIIEKHNGALKVTTDLFISEKRFSEVCAKNGAPSAGDLLLTSVGTLGVPYVVKPGERFYFKDGNLTWFRKFDKIISDYLYYWFLSPSGKAELKRCTIGSSQPAFTIVLLKDIEIALPPLAVQQRIASILSAYDDLIDNNTRRIEILEEIAQRLYEEWFVYFRFPGHEEMGFKESELGEIPEGWEVQELGNVAQINPEAIKPKSAPDDVHYIDIASVSPGRIDKAETMQFSNAPGRARRIVRSGDVLWSCVRPNRRSCAMIIEPEKDTVASTGFAVLRAESISKHYLYQYVRADQFVSYLVNRATGAAYPAVKASDFKEAVIIVPQGDILSHFDDSVAPMRSLIHRLERKNANLRAQRDLLIPKLISGEVDVSDIPMPEDKEVEAA